MHKGIMKIKTFFRTYNNTPNKCEHEWREFGTRLCEEVYIPVRETMDHCHLRRHGGGKVNYLEAKLHALTRAPLVR